MRWPWSPRVEPAPPRDQERESFWSTHGIGRVRGEGFRKVDTLLAAASKMAPGTSGSSGGGFAMDADDVASSAKAYRRYGGIGISDALAEWYASQTFIGYQLCAILAQQWLIDKACTMPARDAIRNGFVRNGPTPKVVDTLSKADKAFRLGHNMEQFVRQGRIFGIRIVIFRVESNDPNYYEYPFNPDAVTPGSYRGMSQVDPYWTAPVLDARAASDPASPDFYEPTWWSINGKLYHKSHLHIFRTTEVPDLLKPVYQYGGVPLPQRIMERVYAAERTANEAPQLAMTKRLTVWKTDMAEMVAASRNGTLSDKMATWTEWRDNYGIKGIDQGEEMEQHDTSLNDLDEVIMSQYQLVAAIANVPATKMLGTTPKGFNATGAYEEASYHEELETIQTHDLTPLVERHDLLVSLSEGLSYDPADIQISWNPTDSPTAAEVAAINKTNAETGKILVDSGAIDGQDERDRIRDDPDSGYTDLADIAPEPEPVVMEVPPDGPQDAPAATSEE
jgi:phage-related protein (TIGR01555 family)